MWYDDEITQAILHNKYLHKGEKTFDDLVNRVSSIYSDDIKTDVKEALYNGDFCPGGRTLYAAGMKNKKKLTGSNCYCVDSPKDTLESICEIDYQISKIGSQGGGVGLALDYIRPKGSLINNSAKVSDGVAFCLHKYNQTGSQIGQGQRKMAIMIMLSCTHPDIEEFLHIKQNGEKLSAMNISIKFTDEFMEAVVQNKTVDLYFKVESTGEEIIKTINAKEFFEEFCKTNKDWGDPGSVFIDRVQKYHLLSGYEEYKIETSNPCSEFFAIGGNSCNLGSINLYNIVDYKFTNNSHINWNKLEYLVRLGIRMLDETLDYGYDMQPLDIHRKVIDDWRSIGLGVFGLADMFIALKQRYGSQESLNTLEQVFYKINLWALDESSNLAREKGTYGRYDCDKQKQSPLIQNLLNTKDGEEVYHKIESFGLRNGTLLVIAPTGSLSMFMGRLSGGVEPLFKCYYDRTSHSGEEKDIVFRVYSKSVEELLKYNDLPLTLSSEEIKQKFDFVVESYDINYNERIQIQSVMQKYVDNAISSTINLKAGTSIETIKDIFIKAWKEGCKGLTVFCEDAKRKSILGVKQKDKVKNEEIVTSYDTISPTSRRNVKAVNGTTYKMQTACSKMFITVNKTDNGDLFEVFSNITGGCSANISSICRLVSASLRSGVKVEKIIEELRAVACPACQTLRRRGEKDIELSCGNAIAKALEMSYNKDTQEETISGLEECPSCHKQTLKPEGRCKTCQNCGWSRCD